MSNKKTRERAAEDKREGKSPSTQAGEFVREEIHHVREGKHGARSAKQVIAIGLSKARRAGVALPTPKRATAAVRKRAARDAKVARTHHEPSRRLASPVSVCAMADELGVHVELMAVNIFRRETHASSFARSAAELVRALPLAVTHVPGMPEADHPSSRDHRMSLYRGCDRGRSGCGELRAKCGV